MPISKLTPEIIAAAIEGFEGQKRQIDGKIAELRQLLKPAAAAETGLRTPAPAKRKRRLSAAGRKAIADAARKRWAAVKAAKALGEPGRAAAKKSRRKRRAAKS